MDLIGFIFTSSHTVIVHQIPIHILQEIKNYGKSIVTIQRKKQKEVKKDLTGVF